jgi:elongation factor Tu
MGLFGGLFGSKNGPDAAAFALRVEMLFPIAGRGTVVTGAVQAGAITSGDTIYFTTAQGKKISCRADVQLDEETLPGVTTALVGMNAGLLLRGIEEYEVPAGTMIFGTAQ